MSELMFPKPHREKKPKKGLKAKTRLKAHYEPIPKEIKEAVLQEKGRLCFCGHCPNCGAAPVGLNDDFHHFPRRSKGGKDIVDHLWPCRRECHDYIHLNPMIERMMFREIEESGIKVIWKATTKGIGLQEDAG
jgi:5-methylcytosine-specific restriction endonuclease McrA